MAVLVVLVILLAFRRRLTRRWRIALHGWRRALLVLLLVLHGRVVFLHLAFRRAVLLLVLHGRVVFLHVALRHAIFLHAALRRLVLLHVALRHAIFLYVTLRRTVFRAVRRRSRRVATAGRRRNIAAEVAVILLLVLRRGLDGRNLALDFAVRRRAERLRRRHDIALRMREARRIQALGLIGRSGWCGALHGRYVPIDGRRRAFHRRERTRGFTHGLAGAGCRRRRRARRQRRSGSARRRTMFGDDAHVRTRRDRMRCGRATGHRTRDDRRIAQLTLVQRPARVLVQHGLALRERGDPLGRSRCGHDRTVDHRRGRYRARRDWPRQAGPGRRERSEAGNARIRERGAVDRNCGTRNRTRTDEGCRRYGCDRAVYVAVGVIDARVIDIADRKSTRLNSSHPSISYAVFCLKKKKKKSAHC